MDFEYLGIDISKLPTIQAPVFNPLSDITAEIDKRQQRVLDAVAETHEERSRRAEDRHQEILSKIDETNTILTEKLTAANETLDFVLNSIGGNFQRIERQHILTNTLF